MLFWHFRFLSGRRPKRQRRSRTNKLYYFSLRRKNLRVAIESDLRPKKSPTSNVAMKYSRFEIDYYKIGGRLEKFPLLLFVWNKKFRHSIIVRHKSLDARKKACCHSCGLVGNDGGALTVSRTRRLASEWGVRGSLAKNRRRDDSNHWRQGRTVTLQTVGYRKTSLTPTTTESDIETSDSLKR